MEKETPKARRARRAKTATQIHKAVELLWKRSFKLPSFTGKARFIDSIKRIETKAFVLADNLKHEVNE